MLRPLWNIRLTHRDADLKELDRATFPSLDEAYATCHDPGISELLILQTCNRVELYLIPRAPEPGLRDRLLAAWADSRQLDEHLRSKIRFDTGDATLQHWIRVAAGLDAMLVGEPQVLHQLREAIHIADARSTLGPTLRALAEGVIAAARDIRHRTALGKGAVSIGTAAVQVAQHGLGPLRDKRVLLIGAGEVGLLVGKALHKHATHVSVTSRRPSHAHQLASRFGYQTLAWQDALARLGEFELIITAVRAPRPFIPPESLTHASSSPRRVILDLGSPRNVDPRAASTEHTLIRSLEDIRSVADVNRRQREAQVAAAERLLPEWTARLSQRLRRRDFEPVIATLYQQAETVRSRELQRALRHLGPLTARQRAALDAYGRAVIEGLLEAPVRNLRRAHLEGNETLVGVGRRLFELGGPQQ